MFVVTFLPTEQVQDLVKSKGSEVAMACAESPKRAGKLHQNEQLSVE